MERGGIVMYVKHDHIKYLRQLLVKEIINNKNMNANEEAIIKDLMAYLTIEEHVLNAHKLNQPMPKPTDGRPRGSNGQYVKSYIPDEIEDIDDPEY